MLTERSKLYVPLMKPEMNVSSFCREERRAPRASFPRTDYCFQSGCDFYRGNFSPDEEGDRGFYDLRRQFLAEAAREQKRELIVLSLITLTCAWPVLSMVVTVVQLFSRQHP